MLKYIKIRNNRNEDDIIKKIIYIVLGSLFLGLGAIGIIVPILPTTPFLLLSAYFYLRSSKKLYNWLINHKILGPYVYNYLTYKTIPKKAKISAISLIVITIPIAVIIIDHLVAYIALPVIAIIVCIYLLNLKTLELKK